MTTAMASDQVSVLDLAAMRVAQQAWAQQPIARRLRIVRALRHNIAEHSQWLAGTVPLDRPGLLHRTLADTLCSEVLPLAEACRFLEREAAGLLAPVRQSKRTRPLWLNKVRVETRRQALGVVLIIAPGNYPLFLPGVQALQALCAGNAILWKPAPGCSGAANAVRSMLIANGLDERLFTVLDETSQAAQAAIASGVDKVILTGSADTGRAVMRSLAETLTPAVMELSGCDAVFVLDGADLDRVAAALSFGMRFNSSATCMAPRRLILSNTLADQLVPNLVAAMTEIAPTPLPQPTRQLLRELVDEATLFGARVPLNGLDNDGYEAASAAGVTLIDRAASSMRIAQSDIFAPVLTILRAESLDHALSLHRECPYALSASVFGAPRAAAHFASRVHAGTVLINDIIVASADPRVSFGGLGASGFGSTRGALGLLEMTSAKTVITQRSASLRAYQPTTAAHAGLFASLLRILHGRGFTTRFSALRELITAARKIT
jgi:acyl-CoA reductase-like NAD-dependent aldehyde dehydrogenase